MSKYYLDVMIVVLTDRHTKDRWTKKSNAHAQEVISIVSTPGSTQIILLSHETPKHMEGLGSQYYSLVPRPFEGRRKGLIHTVHACTKFMDIFLV